MEIHLGVYIVTNKHSNSTLALEWGFAAYTVLSLTVSSILHPSPVRAGIIIVIVITASSQGQHWSQSFTSRDLLRVSVPKDGVGSAPCPRSQSWKGQIQLALWRLTLSLDLTRWAMCSSTLRTCAGGNHAWRDPVFAQDPGAPTEELSLNSTPVH